MPSPRASAAAASPVSPTEAGSAGGAPLRWGRPRSLSADYSQLSSLTGSARVAAAGGWRAHEGIMLGMPSLLLGLASAAGTATERERTLEHVCSTLVPTLFQLLAHPQLTVRETAEVITRTLNVS